MERDEHGRMTKRKTWTSIVEALDVLFRLAVILAGALYFSFVAP